MGERVRQLPESVAPLTAVGAAGGSRTLSDAGRRYFKPLIGSAVDHARLHVDERAERLARLAGATALTHGNDVFIPRAHFAPESADGRALLGHELAHVAHQEAGALRVFRKPGVEPHYPTEEEQRQIEELLSRHSAPPPKARRKAPGKPAVAPGQPAAVPGGQPAAAAGAQPAVAPDQVAVQDDGALSEMEIRALADRLKAPYYATLDELEAGARPSTGAVLDERDAFANALEARDAILARFGGYISRHFTLTRDATTTSKDRKANDQVLVTFSEPDDLVPSVARTLIRSHCQACLDAFKKLDSASSLAVRDALVETAMRERREQLQRITVASVPGAFKEDEAREFLRLKPSAEARQTAIHELIHAWAHPVWNAAFKDEDNINEGFTEYFTQEIVGGVNPSYKKQYEAAIAVRDSMRGPFHLSGVGGSPEESMRLAYFRGRLDLIGWRPVGPEGWLVKRAADPRKPEEGKAWDADTARRYAELHQAEARAKQAPSRNVLGVGLHFSRDSADAIAVRYARVVARTEPLAKGQLLVEGQLLGSPVQDPGRIGASLGIGVEYQEPHFYAQGGARFVGTAALAGGANRLDVSPFVGLGVRAWQAVRVGVEGFVVVPVLAGQDGLFGAAATVGIEFR